MRRDQVPFGAAPKPLPPAPRPPMGSPPWTREQRVSLSAFPGAPTLLLWQPASPAQPNPLTRCLTLAQSRLPEVGTVWQLLHLAFRLQLSELARWLRGRPGGLVAFRLRAC